MQAVSPDGSSARGFAGLASLGIPVDDLLSDIAVPANKLVATDLPSQTTGSNPVYLRRGNSARKRVGGLLVFAGSLLAALALAAFVFLRLDEVDPADARVPSTQVDADIRTLEQPPVGSELVLTRSQIRYCLAEEIRLQAARDQTATQRLDIDRLNASVADLNARCGSFKYQGSDLALAEADIAHQSAALVVAGRADFLLADEGVQAVSTVGGSEATLAAPSNGDANLSGSVPGANTSMDDTADTANQKLVRDVQWLLFKLGFYNGVMSGVDTESTRAARVAYLSERNRDPSTSLEETFSLLKVDTEQLASATRAQTPADNGEASATTDTPAAQDEAVETAQAQTTRTPAPVPAVTPDLSGLADADRLAIEQLCRATASGEGYAGCLEQQLADLGAAPSVPLTQLDDSERRLALAQCGPVRGRDGPAAYYLCLAAFIRAPASAPVPTPQSADFQLPENVVSAIEGRCVAQLTAESGEYARCISGQFANLSDALNPLFIKAINFFERASIESVCEREPGVSDISAFYSCVRLEMQDLRAVGSKPDMKVAGFEDRKDIESVCRQDRLGRGPADYYRCLSRELAVRGY